MQHSPPDGCRDAATPAEKAAKAAANEAELAAAQAEERLRQAQRDAEVAASWDKEVLAEGSGRRAERGLRARCHVTGRAHVDPSVVGRAKATNFESGSVFEDSRERQVPLLLLLGRGILVPGLDAALLGMCEGERAEVTVRPTGGYGAGGSVELPCVPGSATLVYDVELEKLDDEVELWDLSFEEKMSLAAERRLRGNTLFRQQTGARVKEYLLYADAEYEQAKRYLVFCPHLEEQQVPPHRAALVAVNLNLAATKLRMGREEEAVKMCNAVLEASPGEQKALYRLGQAYTQLGKYGMAREQLQKAEAASVGDEDALAAVVAEQDRLQKRQERHARDRKKMAERMLVDRPLADDPEEEPPASAVSAWLSWRPSERAQELGGRALGATIVGSVAILFAGLLNKLIFGNSGLT